MNHLPEQAPRSIRLTDDLWAAVEAEAVANDMSVAAWLRFELRKRLKHRLEVQRLLQEARDG